MFYLKKLFNINEMVFFPGIFPQWKWWNKPHKSCVFVTKFICVKYKLYEFMILAHESYNPFLFQIRKRPHAANNNSLICNHIRHFCQTILIRSVIWLIWWGALQCYDAMVGVDTTWLNKNLTQNQINIKYTSNKIIKIKKYIYWLFSIYNQNIHAI